MANFQVLKIKPGKERSLVNKHPWVFSGAVSQIPKTSAGEVVQVETESGIIGYGFFEPESQIMCRVFLFTDQLTKTVFDQTYWVNKFNAALEWRKSQLDNQTTAFRAVFSESDSIPGLIADVYENTLVVQTGTSGAEKVLNLIIPNLKSQGFKTVIHHQKPVTGKGESKVDLLLGNEEDLANLTMLENGIRFGIDPINGQKTGFFLDQRDARNLLKSYAKGKTVLNTFSYSGGFSLYALAGGAEKVQSADISPLAIKLCEKNILLNPNLDIKRHEGVRANCFEYLRKDLGDWDIIILDPPALAKKSFDVDKAARGYKEINRQALLKMKPGGLLFTFSCSQHISKDLFRKIVFSAAADAGRPCRILHQLSQGIDHPVSIFHPESEYLKGLVLQITA